MVKTESFANRLTSSQALTQSDSIRFLNFARYLSPEVFHGRRAAWYVDLPITDTDLYRGSKDSVPTLRRVTVKDQDYLSIGENYFIASKDTWNVLAIGYLKDTESSMPSSKRDALRREYTKIDIFPLP